MWIDIGKFVYVVDDQIVVKMSGGVICLIVGIICDVDVQGVWFEFQG